MPPKHITAHLKKKLETTPDELTASEIGKLSEAVNDIHAVLGEQIDNRIKILQSRIYDLQEDRSELEGAWKDWDYGFFRSQNLLSKDDYHFLGEFFDHFS
jgi:UDP:flavonoid glycosyltransferase YjiC (YdhE family)